jgi:intracellular septation protein A
MEGTAKPTTWQSIKTNLSLMPWWNFIPSMFIPLTIMDIARIFQAGLLGAGIAMVWLIIFAVLSYVLKREVNVFAIITFLVTATHVMAAFLSRTSPFFDLVPSLDNFIIGLIFVGSMLRPRPFVMSLVGKDTIQRTEAKFGQSKYFFKAWFDINIIWGLFYIFQGIVVSYTLALQMETGEIFDFIFSWPIVLVLLYLSIDYPHRYWTRHWARMKVEIDAAQEYQKSHSENKETAK